MELSNHQIWKLFLGKSSYESKSCETSPIFSREDKYERHFRTLCVFHRTLQQARSGGQGDTTASERQEVIELAADAQETTADASNSDTTQQSIGAGLFADIASMPWAWTLHSLFRIINELPTEAELINKFIYHEIEKDPNQDLTDLTMEKTAEKL
jgi:hypothetical protein